jgi:hypothetical protein
MASGFFVAAFPLVNQLKMAELSVSGKLSLFGNYRGSIAGQYGIDFIKCAP